MDVTWLMMIFVWLAVLPLIAWCGDGSPMGQRIGAWELVIMLGAWIGIPAAAIAWSMWG